MFIYLLLVPCLLVTYHMPDIFISPSEEQKKEQTVTPVQTSSAEPSPVSQKKPETPFPPQKKRKLLQKMREKIPIGNSLASFAAYPKGVRFETQEDQEEIVFILRRHFITNLVWILIVLLMIFIPLFIFPFMGQIFPLVIPLNFQIIGLIIWYAFIASAIFMSFLVWYYNVYIVTDERVVDVDFYNLTIKQIASAPMEHIQDVTIQSGGILRTIFDYAWIRIQTAGTKDYICFEDIPHPDIVARKILELAEKNRNEQKS